MQKDVHFYMEEKKNDLVLFCWLAAKACLLQGNLLLALSVTCTALSLSLQRRIRGSTSGHGACLFFIHERILHGWKLWLGTRCHVQRDCARFVFGIVHFGGLHG
jgi:hypothetical protein